MGFVRVDDGGGLPDSLRVNPPDDGHARLHRNASGVAVFGLVHKSEPRDRVGTRAVLWSCVAVDSCAFAQKAATPSHGTHYFRGRSRGWNLTASRSMTRPTLQHWRARHFCGSSAGRSRQILILWIGWSARTRASKVHRFTIGSRSASLIA